MSEIFTDAVALAIGLWMAFEISRQLFRWEPEAKVPEPRQILGARGVCAVFGFRSLGEHCRESAAADPRKLPHSERASIAAGRSPPLTARILNPTHNLGTQISFRMPAEACEFFRSGQPFATASALLASFVVRPGDGDSLPLK